VKEIRDDAVVLRTYKSGESDRVVVLWTRNYGKVRVLAKGIRKTTSRLGGNLETLAHVNVDLVKTRGEFYIARHVAHRERLITLRKSYARINAGYAVVEVMDAIPSDDVADEDIFELLTRVLLTLDDETYDPMLVPSSFYFKLLAWTDRVRSSTSASTADVTCPWSRSTPRSGHAVRRLSIGHVDLAQRAAAHTAHHERGLGGGAARGVARRCRGGDGDRARFDRVALRQATARGALDAAALAAVTGR